MELKISIPGFDTFKKNFAESIGKVKDLRPLWGKIHGDFLQVEKELFETEGGSGASGKWVDLMHRKYIRWKRINYPGRPILVMRGDLKRSLTEVGNSNHIYNSNPLFLEMGTRDQKAEDHYLGRIVFATAEPFNGEWVKLPVRRSIDLTNKNITSWFQLSADYIKEVINGK